jgi:rare lipoprotein A
MHMRLFAFAIAGVWLCWSSGVGAQDNGAAVQQGKASYYSDRLQGKKTASGALMDQGAMTAASKKLPLGAKAKVTNLETGKTADVKINDRGPVPKGRVIDVSKQAAKQLGINKEEGVAPVKVEAKPADQPTPELKEKVEQAAKH